MGEGENRLSADESTIKANGLSEQYSVHYGEWVKHLSREDRNCCIYTCRRDQEGIREKWGNRLSAVDSTIKANGSSDC